MEINAQKEVSKTVKEAKGQGKESTKHKVWLGTYVILSLTCLTVHFLLRIRAFNLLGTYRDIFLKLSIAGFFSFVVLIIAKIIEGILTTRVHTRAVQYNLVKLIRLLSVLVIVFLIISFLNENWYTAAVSLGLISLILGFALQSPIASLIGWFYIVIRAPYKVGDRIQVSEFTGDVVEINYLDTTLWEFGGTYLSNDLPSGRLIRFPNSYVWQYGVFNYSWKKFPYIWNEIPFHVAYESDFDFIEKTIRKEAKEELGEAMEEKVEQMRDLIRQTPVDELEIKEYPFVNLRINANTWVEVLLIYLVQPKQAAAVRTRMIRRILSALSKEPDKALFPKSNAR